MAAKKLSEITQAIGAPASNDFLVGVTSDNKDKLFAVSNVGGFKLAQSNLTFYVATTGSDSNPGTLAQPFATLDRALAFAADFDYQDLYSPTINVEDGTYINTNEIIFPPLLHAGGSGHGAVVGNFAVPGNVILTDNLGVVGIGQATGDLSLWDVGGVTFDTATFVFSTFVGAFFFINGDCHFTDSSAGGAMAIALGNGYSGGLFCDGVTITFNQSHVGHLCSLFLGSFFQIRNATIVQQSSTVWGGSDNLSTYSRLRIVNSTFTNAGSSTGGGVSLVGQSSVSLEFGAALPYTGAVIGDDDCSSSGAFFGFSKSGLPVAGDLDKSTWAIFKDTSGGGVYLAYNDAGTLKKVQLT